MEIDPLQRALIEKFGRDYGFEVVLDSPEKSVCLTSARHRTQLSIKLTTVHGQYLVEMIPSSPNLLTELNRTFPNLVSENAGFVFALDSSFTAWLRRIAVLSHALPDQAATEFEALVAREIAALPAPEITNTEVIRMMRQRIGQQTYRQAMLNYWDGKCAVTGLTLASALRASHAKPWAECLNDAERLDVFNGFLLSANLDALFDRFLITFDDLGFMVVSSIVGPTDRILLGISTELRLRWLTSEHQQYLLFHRSKFIELNALQSLARVQL